MSVERPAFVVGSDRYLFTWEETSSEICLERLGEGRNGELRGELTVRSGLKGHGVIHKAHINLLADTTVKRLAKTLEERVPQPRWYDMLLQVVETAVDHFRAGDPLVDLFARPEPPDDGTPDWLLSPYLLRSGPSVFFALGGSGKGYLACSMALSIATGAPLLGTVPDISGPVAYLDWEASQRDTHKRLLRLARGAGISPRDVLYKRPKASLVSIADSLVNELLDLGVVAVVVDSLGLARGGAPESAEETIRMFNAISRLGVPAICVDHVSKSASTGDGPDMPIGSVYTQNSARVVWSIRSSSRPGELFVHMRNTKINEGPLAKDRNVAIGFGGREVTLTFGAPPPPTSGTVWERLSSLMSSNGSATVAELARATDKTQQHVRKELERHAERGECEQVGGTELWRLVEAPEELPIPFGDPA